MNQNNGVWENLPNELYVIGDIHGDFYALKQALELTGCVIFENEDINQIIKQHGPDIKVTDGCDYYSANLLKKECKKILWNEKKNNCFIVFAGDLIDRCRHLNITKDFVHWLLMMKIVIIKF